MQPTLPAEVLDQLAPVLASLDVEVRQAVTTVAHNKVAHAGKVILRANGTGGGYEHGFNAIEKDVFSGALPAPASHDDDDDDYDDERDCDCTQCQDSGCDGECDACEDYYNCTQCHTTSYCCGQCDSCNMCHGPENGGGYTHTSNDGVDFCTNCVHFCADN